MYTVKHSIDSIVVSHTGTLRPCHAFLPHRLTQLVSLCFIVTTFNSSVSEVWCLKGTKTHFMGTQEQNKD